MPKLSGKNLRDAERAIHLAAGVGLLVLAFTPLGQGEIGSILRIAVAPMVVMTGLLMWQHARVTRLMRSAGRAPAGRRAGGA